MKVRKTFVIEELPWELRMALLRFAGAHTDGTGYFAIDSVTIVGKRLPHEEHARERPYDDATGFRDPDPDIAGAIG